MRPHHKCTYVVILKKHAFVGRAFEIISFVPFFRPLRLLVTGVFDACQEVWKVSLLPSFVSLRVGGSHEESVLRPVLSWLLLVESRCRVWGEEHSVGGSCFSVSRYLLLLVRPCEPGRGSC